MTSSWGRRRGREDRRASQGNGPLVAGSAQAGLELRCPGPGEATGTHLLGVQASRRRRACRRPSFPLWTQSGLRWPGQVLRELLSRDWVLVSCLTFRIQNRASACRRYGPLHLRAVCCCRVQSLVASFFGGCCLYTCVPSGSVCWGGKKDFLLLIGWDV